MRNIAMTQVMRKNENYRMNPSTARGDPLPLTREAKIHKKFTHSKTMKKLKKTIDTAVNSWYNISVVNADVAELADARDLKSRGSYIPYRFDPGHRHHKMA